MEWNVKNAISRDVEREHLNKILKEIASSVQSLGNRTTLTRDDVVRIVQDLLSEMEDDVSDGKIITVTLQGDVTGTGSGEEEIVIVTNTSTPDLPGADGMAYWMRNDEWQQVPFVLQFPYDFEGTGFVVIDDDAVWHRREIEVVTTDLTVANPEGATGNPLLGLADVPDSGAGTFKLITRDSKGRLSGTEDGTTDDVPEGIVNLYFTDERAQDAAGAAIAAGTGDGVTLSYDDAGNAIDATNTDKGSVAVADHVAQSDPHPQYVENAEKGVSNGIATLDSSAKLQANQLPALAITETFVVNSEAAMLAAPAQQGDVAVRTDLTKSFILTADPASTLANWQELLHPYSGGTVTSVELSMPSVFTVSGSPVTSSGTLFVALASQSAGLVWASPSGSAGEPVFRSLVESDIPSLNWSKITAGKPTTLSGYGITDALPSSAIVQSITDGDTTHVPSGDAVFDALAGKADDAKLTVIAGLSANQALANATTTKVNLNTESVDTDGCFDPATGRFTPTKSGVYLVISTIPFGYVSGTITSGQRLITYVYLNGVQYTAITGGTNNSATNIIQAIALVPMNGATDYLEMYARRDTTAEYQINSGSAGAQFSAIRISA